MKTKSCLLIILLSLGFLFTCCKKEFDPEEWVTGKWVNEFSDTICFSNSIVLINKMPYGFRIIDDSLKVIPAWSSTLQEFGHKMEINKSDVELYIYDFLMHSKSSFKRLEICDCLIFE
jgi:hypothetical protein